MEDNGDLTGQQDQHGRFVEGNTMGKGRPPGSRNKLSNAFIEALKETFENGGKESLEELMKEAPAQYHRIIASLMPKLMELSGPDGGDIPLSGTVKFRKAKKADDKSPT